MQVKARVLWATLIALTALAVALRVRSYGRLVRRLEKAACEAGLVEGGG